MINNYQTSKATKAENLFNLVGKLQHSIILDIFYFTYREWLNNPTSILDKVKAKFYNEQIIIRSSSRFEDDPEASEAGRFKTVLNVDPLDHMIVSSSITEVFDSYRICGNEIDDCQVLIQPMFLKSALSGVIFTREINDGAPYYVINYDCTGNTDGVTSGLNAVETVKIFKDTEDIKIKNESFVKILAAAKELEKILDNDALDIEFALDSEHKFYLFQVRAITRSKFWSGSADGISQIYAEIADVFSTGNIKEANIFGDEVCFANMTDWNPVEMIGARPRQLAYSLYRRLITKDVWRKARTSLGYNDPANVELMKFIGGQPYINVRNSFNSFLPANIPAQVKEKLVNFWIRKLIDNPELQDKAEFQVVHSSYTFTTRKEVKETYSSVLNDADSETFISALKDLTVNAITGSSLDNAINSINKLTTLSGIVVDNICPLLVADSKLRECELYGTTAFAIIARHAFIAEAILRSLIDIGAMTVTLVDVFRQALNTISSDFLDDAEKVIKGTISKAFFLERYGHLRPGTYDIRSKRYDQMENFFDNIAGDDTSSSRLKTESNFILEPESINLITDALAKHQLSFSCNDLMNYISKAIVNREYAKFVFTKQISNALESIATWGSCHGLTREDLSFIEIDQLIDFSSNNDPVPFALEVVNANSLQYKKYELLKLPDVLSEKTNLGWVEPAVVIPNYITNKYVTGPIKVLNTLHEINSNIDGKIVCIESADPGFDWIFLYDVKGLVTKFGGSNSHMSIRCAEFGIPAAIGCGSEYFDKIQQRHFVTIDCENQQIIFA